jgi:hypothetical protein
MADQLPYERIGLLDMAGKVELLTTAPLRKVVQRIQRGFRMDWEELVCGHVVQPSTRNQYHAESRRCIQCMDEMNVHLSRML